MKQQQIDEAAEAVQKIMSSMDRMTFNEAKLLLAQPHIRQFVRDRFNDWLVFRNDRSWKSFMEACERNRTMNVEETVAEQEKTRKQQLLDASPEEFTAILREMDTHFTKNDPEQMAYIRDQLVQSGDL